MQHKIECLDNNAISYAREKFLVKFPEFKEDVTKWDNLTFLNKAKITIRGKITRTAIILLGKSESESFLIPSIAKMCWILKTLSKDLIIEYLNKWKEASRKQIENLLLDKLSDVLDEKSKKSKIMHLLQKLRKEAKIRIEEGRKWSRANNR